ncbi:Rieske 2Fe-2S domain-containing protein [Actinomadura rubrisoli]|uniref:Rieske domain-containing protein n=1 Tax=Actinomadura rubrisoli TaxID=2530368 RepID=A0A4R5CAT4_9ACTN|nr:Rieske 2Fe-2S domain-containing protein [Actinomadura rubrisoli]TDD95303.1 hypothetical protein E1298_05410 [Actinomadura rubrisoli]
MPVVTFPVEGRDNCAVVDGTPYVYATVRGEGFVMRARCAHRGGPLHLAAVAAESARLVCPWHERKTSLTRLRAEIPAVRTGGRVTAVIPDRRLALVRPCSAPPAPPALAAPSAPSVELEHRPLSRDLARAAGCG